MIRPGAASVLTVFALVLHVFAQSSSVTLYRVQTFPTTTQSDGFTETVSAFVASDLLSAVGVDPTRGVTTYVEDIVITRVDDAEGPSGSLKTFTNTAPQTIRQTYVAAATGIQGTYPIIATSPGLTPAPSGSGISNNTNGEIYRSCSFSGTSGAGECVEEIRLPKKAGGDSVSVTQTRTYRGEVQAFQTIAAYSGVERVVARVLSVVVGLGAVVGAGLVL